MSINVSVDEELVASARKITGFASDSQAVAYLLGKVLARPGAHAGLPAPADKSANLMKASKLWMVESTWEALKHDLVMLEAVQVALRDGTTTLEVKLNGAGLFEGAFGEPHDIDKRDRIERELLTLAEQYFQSTLNSLRRDLASLGFEVDV